MTTILATEPETTAAPTNIEPSYTWYLANRDEIVEIIETNDFLRTLQQLENENDLPAGTAERFAAIHADASNVPEQEEWRYMAAWDAYHEALDSDSNLATLARVYGERVRMPIEDRLNADGTFIF
jgi:hypothetical protein